MTETTTTTKEHAESLIAKAATANDSSDAMRFSQAALNVANTICTLKNEPK